jgi:TonB-linked SusC/RagA family outer membrane protein
MKKNIIINVFFLLIFFGMHFSLSGQTGELTGRVVDGSSNSSPIPGATVILDLGDGVANGNGFGVITDINGNFSIKDIPYGVPFTLRVSFIGYSLRIITDVQINEPAKNMGDIVLNPSATDLSEVVVTALGIEREKRSLGYATQEVKGDDLREARETNIVNSLAGRVSGVNITQGASGPTSSARIVIRGESSLAGDNQPLFVVDGIPIHNQTFGANSGQGTMAADFGNGAADINPDDIETINVLKGPNAAALYGSRAANGVILITTKSGKGIKRGIGVSINSSTTFEQPLRLWRYQNKYGVGSNFEFAYVNGMGGGTNDAIDESWGPLMDGRLVPQHDSPTTNGFRAGDTQVLNRGDITPSPFIPQPDGIKNFYETGLTLSNNIAIEGANNDGHFRFSYTNLHNTGILPNTGLDRDNLSLSAGYKPVEGLTLDVTANYINARSDNVKNHGYGTESVEYLWIWWGRSINLDNMKNYWQEGAEGTHQFNYNYNWNDNPYFTMFENTNGFNRDRIFGNIRLHYELSDKLSLLLRSGLDNSNDLRHSRRAFSSQRFPFGMYREDRFIFYEMNSDFLLSYSEQTNLDKGWAWTASIGANRMDQENKRLRVSANQLNVPQVYSLNNSRIPLDFMQFNQKRRINSIYGMAQVSFRNYLFLELTARNDWSSTLPSDNNSYFYPSATMSFVFSDALNLGRHISFGKIRAGYAQVGNDTDPYRLQNFFVAAGNWGSIQTAAEQSNLANSDLLPEIAGSFEIGTDIRLFNDRIGIDLTYYNNDSRNQIISVPISRASGYESRFLNAGLVNSYGIEAMLTLKPIVSNNFGWTANLNFGYDRTYIRELSEGLKVYQLSGQYTSVQARVGERMGNVYGLGLLRADDGRPIYNQSGFPIRRNELELLGNYNPDWIMGLYNSFRYKDFNLGFLFDLSYGGIIYSYTYLIANTSGVHINTEDREGEFIGDGWVRNADGSLSENTKSISGRDYYWSHYNRNNHAEGTFDATYLKLRELRIGYTLSSRLLGENVPFGDITLSIVGRNLWLWAKEIKDFDPDLFHINGSGKFVPGVETSATPSVRSFGFNLSVKF